MNLANMKRSETTEQIGLINWARANEEYVPELRLLHHIPNEGIRTNGPVLKSGRNENGRSGSVFAGSAPWLSWSVYRNEIREREDHKSTRRVYGASSGAGLQNGGGIRSRTGPRSDPALSGPRGRV